MPYTIVGGIRFYERKEIKDLLAYLRVLANPATEASLERSINTPARGIGDQTVGALRLAAREAGISIVELLQLATPVPGLATTSAGRVRVFAELLSELRVTLEGNSLAALLERVLELTSYRDRLEDAACGAGVTRRKHRRAPRGHTRLRRASPADEDGTHAARSLLERPRLVTMGSQRRTRDRLALIDDCTTSKGLVLHGECSSWAWRSALPAQRTLDDAQQLEEERR
jgi:DNA helicase-2/ATP-dependent DNA helicase PcrA